MNILMSARPLTDYTPEEKYAMMRDREIKEMKQLEGTCIVTDYIMREDTDGNRALVIRTEDGTRYGTNGNAFMDEFSYIAEAFTVPFTMDIVSAMSKNKREYRYPVNPRRAK